jgi:hypothetical protein
LLWDWPSVAEQKLGVVIGGVVGLGFGLWACEGVATPLKQKLFDPTSSMSEEDFLELARQTKKAVSSAFAVASP